MTTTKRKKLISNTFALSIMQIVNYLTPLLIMPYLSRIFGIEKFGHLSVLLSLIVLVSIITDFGYNLAGTYFIAKNKEKKSLINEYLGTAVLLKTLILILVISTICFFTFLGKINSIENNSILILVNLNIIFQAFQFIWFFQGIEKMFNITFYTAVGKISYLILVFLFVKDESLEKVLLFYSVGNFESCFLSFFYIYKEKFRIMFPKMSRLKTSFKENFFFFLSRVSGNIYSTFSIFILGQASTYTEAALYSSSDKLYQGGKSVTNPVTQAIYPYVARTKDTMLVSKFVLRLLVPLIICCGFFFIFSEKTLTIFYGKSFADGEKILKVFMLTSVVNFIGVNYGYPAFASISRVDIVNRSVLYASIAQIIYLSFLYFNKCINSFNVVIGLLFTETFLSIYRVVAFITIKRRREHERV